jgi:hypothetical protein
MFMPHCHSERYVASPRATGGRKNFRGKRRENFRLIFKASTLLIVEHNKEDI